MEVLDPVCGMRFDASEAVGTAEHDGKTYYFCGEGCKRAFEEDPERYAANAPGEDEAGAN